MKKTIFLTLLLSLPLLANWQQKTVKHIKSVNKTIDDETAYTIAALTEKHCKNKNLAIKIMRVESRFQPNAIHKLDIGLMGINSKVWQITPCNELFNSCIEENIIKGCQILDSYARQYKREFKEAIRDDQLFYAFQHGYYKFLETMEY